MERKTDDQILFEFLVLRLISPYAIIMNMASSGNPNGYSGIGAAGLTVTVIAFETMDGSESVTLNSNDHTPTAVDALVVNV